MQICLINGLLTNDSEKGLQYLSGFSSQIPETFENDIYVAAQPIVAGIQHIEPDGSFGVRDVKIQGIGWVKNSLANGRQVLWC